MLPCFPASKSNIIDDSNALAVACMQLLERQVVLLDSSGQSLYEAPTPALLYRHPGLHPADIVHVTVVPPTEAISRRYGVTYCGVLLMSTQVCMWGAGARLLSRVQLHVFIQSIVKQLALLDNFSLWMLCLLIQGTHY